jgi:rubredoxin-NAD+ reductase
VTALAHSAGLATRYGIVTNRFLETSSPDIYAVGDCAEVESFVLPYITPLLNCARALARTLSGTRTAVEYPAMPVTIKTPACPVTVCPPPKNMAGHWDIDITGEGARGLFQDATGTLHGFVLTGARMSERGMLIKKIPPLISASQ